MTSLNLGEAAARFGGTLINPDCSFNRVSIDTREVVPGDLFVALEGSRHNAHDYIDHVADVICGAVVSRYFPQLKVAQWVVDDTAKALGLLARLRREKFVGPVVAVTGSSGKTSVKEFIAAILGKCGVVHATPGNYNNHIGLPLSLLSNNEQPDFIVLEMGASNPGEIRYLCSIAQPTVSLINNIQSAHVEGFGSLQGTASAKAEIYVGLSEDGTAIVNLDQDYVSQWRSKIDNRSLLTFSMLDLNADVAATELELESDGCYKFTLTINNESSISGSWPLKLGMQGKHSVANALAAATCALAVGAGIEEIIEGLSNVCALPRRLETKCLPSGGWIIDDTYNASPESAMAAIDVLAARPMRRIMILGDMAELGSEALTLHQNVGAYALESGIDELLTLGELSVGASETFRGKHFQSFNELDRYLSSFTRTDGVTFLVKGSRASAMERVVEILEGRGEKDAFVDK